MKEVGARLVAKGGAAVPLRGVEVVAEVLGGYAHARVRQRYVNEEAKPVEAVYTFPLPSDATLTGFQMTCNGRVVAGEVKEREEAFAHYDDAINAGHGAALLDQERPNVFTASVGNLLPGEETIIEVAYVQRVQADEGAVRWSVPTLVAPRYIPGSPAGDRTAHGAADPTDRVPDADRISPPIDPTRALYGVALDLVFDMGADVVVESPSHPVVVTREGAITRVRFAQREVLLDRDIVVTARGKNDAPLASCLAHKVEKGGVFALTVVPDLLALDTTKERLDVCFVVDVSGSMAGESIQQAKAALSLCVRHLREGDRFNVIAFNERAHPFAPEPVPFTQVTLAGVDAWIAGLQANGGTEMLQPLAAAVRNAPDGVIVVLTDGQVGNENEIARAVLDARRTARIYSFGIGTNVSDALLQQLAKGSGGAVEYIHPGERIDEKVLAQFARATAARVTDVRVTFEGLDVGELAPGELPALIDGEPWTLFGRFEEARVGRAEIRGKLRGEPFCLECPVDLAGAAGRSTLVKLWARERIRDLEAAELTGRRAQANKDRIVRLAVEHQVSSQYTSFVVVEKRTGDRRTSGTPETRVIPVNVPAGWDMFDQKKRKAGTRPSPVPARPTMPGVAYGPWLPAPPPPRSAPPPLPRALPPMAVARMPMRPAAAKEPAPMDAVAPAPAMYRRDAFTGEARCIQMPPEPPQDPVTALLAKQLASGMWDEPAEAPVKATIRALLFLLKHDVTSAHPLHGAQVKKAVEALVARAVVSPDKAPDVCALALAVAWLISSGPRSRGTIANLVDTNAAFASLKGRLDETSLRADLDRLAGLAAM